MRSRTLLLALLVLAGTAQADKPTRGQEAYVEGVRSFDAGDYGTAAARMRTALVEDAIEAPSRFRFRGLNAEDYFPHLYLGLSLEKLGARDEAFEKLRESHRQGAISKRPTLLRILESALARVAPLPSPTPAPPPSPTVALAATSLPLQAPLAPAQAAPPSEVPAGSSQLQAAVRTAAPAVTRPAEVASAARESRNLASLREGVRAYFRGDYAGAERILSDNVPQSGVSRLFLAFALGSRYLLEGGKDALLLERARAEYRAALSSGVPGGAASWVSPSLVALLAGRPVPASVR